MTKTLKQKILLFSLMIVCILTILFSSISLGKSAFAEEIDEPQTTSIQTFQNINVQSGLGFGINVLDAENVADIKAGNSILDNTVMQQMPLNQFTYLNNDVDYTLSIGADELLINYNGFFDVSAGVDGFLYSLGLGVTSGASIDYSEYAYKLYYTYCQNAYRYKLGFVDYGNKNTYAQAFSNYFLQDLQALQDNEITIEQFFDTYGTHLVGCAIFGGKMLAQYTVLSNTIAIDTVLKDNVNGSLQVFDTNIGAMASITARIDQTISVGYNQSDFVSHFNVKAMGGSPFGTTNVSALEQNVNDWLESLGQEEDVLGTVNTIVDYASDGLIPLWEILPEEYSTLALAMENAFVELSNQQRTVFLNEFKTGNYVDFSGGLGTCDSPYIIETVQQLLNISRVDMSAYYELANDIDLSGTYQWIPIGGYYNTKPFKGCFDGNGYAINGLTKTESLAKSIDYRCYFGLFGSIGANGVVKNVRFTNVNMSISSQEYVYSSDRLFMGVVAGIVTNGKIENVIIESGTVSNNRNVTGMMFIGGIAGYVKNSNIIDCTNNAKIVSGRYSGIAGGIAGYGYGTSFIHCTNTGRIEAYGTGWGGYAYAGGIMGAKYYNPSNDCVFTNCTHTGSLSTAQYSAGIGGINKSENSICALTTNSLY